MGGDLLTDDRRGKHRVDASERSFSRRRLLGGVAVGTLAAPFAAACSSAVDAEGWTALHSGRAEVAAAGAFIESIGVVAHWTYVDTPYSRLNELIGLLSEVGIRHVRSDRSPSAVEALWKSRVRSTVLVDINPDDPIPLARQISDLEFAARSGALAAVEGPNEPDLFWSRRNVTYRDQGFPAGVLAYQRDLHRMVRERVDMEAVQVVGPALGKTYWGQANPLGDATLLDAVDFGNLHNYPAGNPFAPSREYAGLSQYYRFSSYPSVTLDEYPITTETYAPPFGNRPTVVTETGYPTWFLGQTESVQGRYVPRIFLENFRLGFLRTFVYELVDEGVDRSEREQNFGLLRHDLSPKPAWRALTTLIASAGRHPGSPGELNYRLEVVAPEGYNPEALHHVLLNTGDDRYVAFLWHEVTAENLSALERTPPQPPIRLTHPPFRVRLSHSSGLRLIDAQLIGESGEPLAVELRVSGTSVELNVPDRVVMVSFRA